MDSHAPRSSCCEFQTKSQKLFFQAPAVPAGAGAGHESILSKSQKNSLSKLFFCLLT